MANQERSNKRRKKSNVVKRRQGNQDILIDKDDFKVINAIKFPNKRWKDRNLKYEVEGDDKRVSYLKISGIRLDDEIVSKIFTLTSLKKLHLIECLFDLSPSIGLLQNLEELDISSSAIVQIPKEIGNLANLEALTMIDTRIEWGELPASIGNLKKLECLDINSSDISELPNEFWDLTSLRSLNALSLSIKIPPSIKRFKNLEILNVGIQGDLPEEIGTLTSLEEINIRKDSGSVKFPTSMVNLKELYHFELEAEKFDFRQLEFIKNLPKIERVYVPGRWCDGKESFVQEFSLIEAA